MKLKWVANIFFIVAILSCSGPGSATDNSELFGKGRKLATLKSKHLREISGMAASHRNPGLLWIHNDSGNEPEVFLVDTMLKVKLIVKLNPHINRDWEGLAIGKLGIDGKPHLFIGDIGDNNAAWNYKYIYVIEEPLYEGEFKILEMPHPKMLVFSTQGKPKDFESLLYDPISERLYVVSKHDDPVMVYEIDPHGVSNDTLHLSPAFTLPIAEAVGGDVSDSGEEILVKSYDEVYYWKRDTSLLLSDAWNTPPQRVPYFREPQGEAIAWSLNASGFFTMSEKTAGNEVYLFYYLKKDLSPK